MTSPRFMRLDKFAGQAAYKASCVLCGWDVHDTSERKVHDAFTHHHCQRELPDLPRRIEDLNWFRHAACADRDPEIWYRESDFGLAIQICNDCPVAEECLYMALIEERTHLAFGVRGGLLPEERRAMRDVLRG